MKAVILAVAMVVSGCTSNIASEVTTVAISKPVPVTQANVKWEVVEGKVCLSPTDGVLLNTQIKDVLRYIKDLQSRLCYLGDEQYCTGGDNEVSN